MLKMRTAFEEKVNFGLGEKQKPESDELTIKGFPSETNQKNNSKFVP